MDQPFAGKVALVTGAGSGIGEAVAMELAEGGARLLVSDLKAEAAERAAAAIRAAGGQALAHQADVTDPAAVQALVALAESHFGALHLAVNNAGIAGARVNTADYPLDSWQRIIDVNLTSVFHCTKYQVAAMLRAGGGAIVNMSSILGSVGTPGAVAYVAAKHGVVGLTKAVALEYAGQGVRVNAVGPGYIDTPLLSRFDRETHDGLKTLHPAGRLGTAREVSALTCFLLSDRAAFITGSYHLVDGGYTAR